jgi:hypothetical protein
MLMEEVKDVTVNQESKNMALLIWLESKQVV